MANYIETSDWKETARLYALIAPRARKAVLLRRGPTDHVRMIFWDMKTDQFAPGQWLKKRVYERRCDLSPDGRYFIYFAADYASQFASWTAISRPPFFTALSLWPQGDGWGGGGLFSQDGQTIYLNHWPGSEGHFHLDKNLGPPRQKVVPLHETSGRGEDDPIRYYRMTRDGWKASMGSRSKLMGRGAPYGFEQKKPTVFEKTPKTLKKPGGPNRWKLRLSSRFTAERQGRWNVEDASIIDMKGGPVLKLGRVDWCDLDVNGDILWAWAGRLWRLEFRRSPHALKLAQPKLLADFNDMVFENIKASDTDRQW